MPAPIFIVVWVNRLVAALRRGLFFDKLTHNDMGRKPQREVLAYFMKGGHLTVQTAIRMFETTELRRIVSRLKQRGHAITSVRRYETTKTGRRVVFHEYFMEQVPGA